MARSETNSDLCQVQIEDRVTGVRHESFEHRAGADAKAAALVEQPDLDQHVDRQVAQPPPGIDLAECATRRFPEAIRLREVPGEGVRVRDDDCRHADQSDESGSETVIGGRA
jgi:hypothetical protein